MEGIKSEQSGKSGYSLIELIVVVAIVSLLVAIAVPMYKNYIVGARIANVTTVIESLMQRSIEFSQANGRFPTAYELGLNSVPDIISDSEHAAGISPYFRNDGSPAVTDGQNTGQAVLDAGNCGKYGTIFGSFNTQALGFDEDVVNRAFFSCDMWHYDGAIYKQCFYGYGLTNDWGAVYSGVSQTDELIPGWINYNATNSFDFDNYNTYEADLHSFINATCQ